MNMLPPKVRSLWNLTKSWAVLMYLLHCASTIGATIDTSITPNNAFCKTENAKVAPKQCSLLLKNKPWCSSPPLLSPTSMDKSPTEHNWHTCSDVFNVGSPKSSTSLSFVRTPRFFPRARLNNVIALPMRRLFRCQSIAEFTLARRWGSSAVEQQTRYNSQWYADQEGSGWKQRSNGHFGLELKAGHLTYYVCLYMPAGCDNWQCSTRRWYEIEVNNRHFALKGRLIGKRVWYHASVEQWGRPLTLSFTIQLKNSG